MKTRTPQTLACRAILAVALTLALGSIATAAYEVRRLTPDFNPGNMPHINSTALHLPIDVDVVPGVSDYLFVSQLGGLGSDDADGDDITKGRGRIVLFDRQTGSVDYENPFLVIDDTNLFDPVGGVPEVGLFSTAFHPDFATNGKFYVGVAVDYDGPAPDLSPRDSRNPPFKYSLREYTANPNDLSAGVLSSRTLLEIDQPSFNHNGSWLGFNPIETAAGDNFLYVTMGDGGDQHDPFNYGQDTESLLGTVMRIDIDNTDPGLEYAIPEDNPFVGTAGRDEIWAYGLRNPWRASFDSLNGDFYVGDVGQGTWEEINYLPGDIEQGDDRNFGWRLREGFVQEPVSGVGGPPPADNVDPLIAYRHGFGSFQGNSVAGGIVYRGPIAEFYGMYIFADSVSGGIWGFRTEDNGTFDPDNPGDTLVSLNATLLPEGGGYTSIVSFAEDEDGNLLIVDHGYDGAGIGGHIYRLEVVNTGDFNGDGSVDILDLDILSANFGLSEGGTTATGDANSDGAVDILDLDILSAQFGTMSPHFAIPEPATAGMGALMVTVLVGAGRRGRVA